MESLSGMNSRGGASSERWMRAGSSAATVLRVSDRRLLRRLPPLLTDGLVALTAAGLALAQMQGYPDPRDRGIVNIGFVLAETLPLTWRRRAPFTVFTVVALSLGAQYILGFRGPLFAFLGFALALYTVAAHDTKGRATVAGAVAGGMMLTSLGWLVVTEWPDLRLVDLYDVLDDSVLLAGAWILGIGIRRSRTHAEELRERAALLEREREEKARRAVTQERMRIARELHDVVAHGLSVIGIQAGAARLVLRSEPERAREAIASIEATVDRAMGEMRRALGLLRDGGEAQEALAPPPGVRELPGLLDQVRRAGLQVEMTVEGVPRPLATSLDLSLYRIVQEGLTNALKYAGAARAQVVLRYGKDSVEVEVMDDGRGPPTPSADDGAGTIGMRQRVALFGGDLQMGPRPGGGYSVRARLPISAQRS